jgi:hypothetical protein
MRSSDRLLMSTLGALPAKRSGSAVPTARSGRATAGLLDKRVRGHLNIHADAASARSSSAARFLTVTPSSPTRRMNPLILISVKVRLTVSVESPR